MEKATDPSSIKILAVVEATTVNAVAKNMLEFHRSAKDLEQRYPDSLKVETSLVTFDRTRARVESPNEFVTAARELGLKVDIIRERFRFDARVVPALRKIVERTSPDIILTHQVKSHLLMKISRLWQKYPWVAFHHGYTTTDRKMRAYNRLNRWSLPTAHRVVTVCEAFARELTFGGVAPERIHVQHNSLRPKQATSAEEVEALRTRLGIASDERMVLSVGRLSREKAHIDLLVAFKHLGKVNRDIELKLIIVGDGTERERLETAAESLDLRGRVVFTGEQSDVQPYYGAADVVVLPSHSEGSPYVLLEAMAAKVPIVATLVGGVPEMVTDEESALLVPARDISAIAGAIARLVTDPVLAAQLAANAFTRVATHYSPDRQTRSLIKLYQSALANDLRSPGVKVTESCEK